MVLQQVANMRMHEYQWDHWQGGWHNVPAGIGALIACIALFLGILTLAAMWQTYKKAGKPGWSALVPIYNLYTFVKMAGRPGWVLLLYFIPLVNVMTAIVIHIDVAHAFKKSTAFGVMSFFLPFVGYWILGYGDAKYKKPIYRR